MLFLALLCPVARIVAADDGPKMKLWYLSPADAAVKEGMPRQKAYIFAAQAVKGSAEMVLKTGRHPGDLKDMVCSPGGTTIEGLAALEECGFRGAIIKACDANYEKNKKLK